MARFIFISFLVAISNTVIFAQKFLPIPMRMFVEETALVTTPFIQSEPPKTVIADQPSGITVYVYNNASSNYVMLEVLGASQLMPFQLINSQGEEMYSGSIRGTQLIETESWPVGTYYLLCGTKRETLYVSK